MLDSRPDSGRGRVAAYRSWNIRKHSHEIYAMASRWLTALPVFNEEQHVGRVLDEVLRYSPEVLVVDDGSNDDTGKLLAGAVTFELSRTTRIRATARPC